MTSSSSWTEKILEENTNDWQRRFFLIVLYIDSAICRLIVGNSFHSVQQIDDAGFGNHYLEWFHIYLVILDSILSMSLDCLVLDWWLTIDISEMKKFWALLLIDFVQYSEKNHGNLGWDSSP